MALPVWCVVEVWRCRGGGWRVGVQGLGGVGSLGWAVIRSMARRGCLAMALVVAAMGTFAPWRSLMKLMARFLNVAETKGALPTRNWWRSSPVTTSRTQWRRFSTVQCSRGSAKSV